MVRIHPQINLSWSEEGRQLSLIPRVRATRHGHIEKKDADTASYANKPFRAQKNIPLEQGGSHKRKTVLQRKDSAGFTSSVPN